MLEELFTALTNAMSERFSIALLASFAWGVASILLSPCHLASIPLIVGYVIKQGPSSGRRTVGLSTAFALGILATIALIGLLTASLGRMLGDVGIWGDVAIGVVFLAVGLYLTDVLKFSWNTATFHPVGKNPLLAALVLGLVFGIGLGPCTFAYLAPVLVVVFGLATTNLAAAVLLIIAFGLGHGSVIVGAGSLAHTVQQYLNWTEQSAAATWVRRIAGILILIGGAYYIYSAF